MNVHVVQHSTPTTYLNVLVSTEIYHKQWQAVPVVFVLYHHMHITVSSHIVCCYYIEIDVITFWQIPACMI